MSSVMSFHLNFDADNVSDTDMLQFGTHLSSDVAFDSILTSLYKFDAKTVCDKISTWAFNRKLNAEHVEKIYQGLKNSHNPSLMGTLKVIRDDKGRFQVIDGQHRVQAMQRYFSETANKQWNVYLEIYHVKTINSPVVFELFRIANNNLNMTTEDDVNMFIANVVDAMVADEVLGKGVIDNDDKRVNRPRIAKKTMYELMKDNIRAHDTHLSVEEIVKRIKKLNQEFKNKSNLEMFGRKKLSDKNTIQKAKADIYNFYLNLDGKFTPEVWIPMIGNVEL